MKLLLLVLCLAGLPSVVAQQPQPAEPGFVIRAETNLALVRFHVLRDGKYVNNLRAEDIRILEDGVEQKIALLAGGAAGTDRVPVEILLLFDVSTSVMSKNLLNSVTVKETLIESVGDHVSVGVYAFGTTLTRFCRPTRDPALLEEAFQALFAYSQDGTMLYEAVVAAVRDASAAGGDATRLMIVFSDGQTTSATTRPRQAVEAARLLGIPVFPVTLGREAVARMSRIAFSGGPSMPPNPDQSRAKAMERSLYDFASIGPATGGRSYDPPAVNPAAVREILRSLGERVRSEYVAGYYLPPSSNVQKPHDVQVILRRKGLGKLYGGGRTVVH